MIQTGEQTFRLTLPDMTGLNPFPLLFYAPIKLILFRKYDKKRKTFEIRSEIETKFFIPKNGIPSLAGAVM